MIGFQVDAECGCASLFVQRGVHYTGRSREIADWIQHGEKICPTFEALQQWLYRDNPVLAWVERRVEAADPVRPGEKVIGIKSSMAHKMFYEWALEEGFAERSLPDVKGFVQRLKENEHVPGITVRHTNAGNFLTGLKILAQDRNDAGAALADVQGVRPRDAAYATCPALHVRDVFVLDAPQDVQHRVHLESKYPSGDRHEVSETEIDH